MIPKSISRFFILADLSREGLDPQEYACRWAGTVGYNNGILAVVDTTGTVWVSMVGVFRTWDPEGIPIEVSGEFQSLYRDGNFLVDTLREAGYEIKGMCGMWIPHSNGDQSWVKAQMAAKGVSRQGLIREIADRRQAEITARRLEKIAAIAASELSV